MPTNLSPCNLKNKVMENLLHQNKGENQEREKDGI